MPRQKTVAELEAEYRRAEERAKKLKEQMKKATAAEDAKLKAELLKAALEWIESYDGFNGIEDGIAYLRKMADKNKARKESDI